MLDGKGMYLWQIKNAESGNPARIASVAKAAGLSHVIIKIMDGQTLYNLRPYKIGPFTRYADDIIQPVIGALHNAGLQVWGYQYLYLYSPELEATAAAKRANDLGLDGFVIDAEAEAKGKPDQVKRFMASLVTDLTMPIALSSYRYPSLHRDLPWSEFLGFLTSRDYIMPQVYWELAHNPSIQLKQCVAEYKKMTDIPIVPTGSAYARGTWSATQGDLRGFMQTAVDLGLTGCNFWEWSRARNEPGLWDAIAGFA